MSSRPSIHFSTSLLQLFNILLQILRLTFPIIFVLLDVSALFPIISSTTEVQSRGATRMVPASYVLPYPFYPIGFTTRAGRLVKNSFLVGMRPAASHLATVAHEARPESSWPGVSFPFSKHGFGCLRAAALALHSLAFFACAVRLGCVAHMHLCRH